MILSILDNKEIGLEVQHNNFDSVFCPGITLAIFGMDRKTPNEKDRLKYIC